MRALIGKQPAPDGQNIELLIMSAEWATPGFTRLQLPANNIQTDRRSIATQVCARACVYLT
jgi:hypothetical protein